MGYLCITNYPTIVEGKSNVAAIDVIGLHLKLPLAQMTSFSRHKDFSTMQTGKHAVILCVLTLFKAYALGGITMMNVAFGPPLALMYY